jgi:inward rectifier potassium channel
VNSQEDRTARHRSKYEIRLLLDEGRTRAPVRLEFFDPYYRLMQASWPAFFAAVVLVFFLINVLFGLIYAALPGSVGNAEPGSLSDAFFFSVDTLATVGYGAMYPASHLGHAIASVEILLGLFFLATVTGLIFARFSRPRAGLLFSRYAVIGRYEGQKAVMIRAAWTRAFPLVDVTAQLSWLEQITDSNGRTLRRLRELELVRSHNPMLGLAWTLIHILPDDSSMLAALERKEPLLLIANVSGTDMLLASSSQGVQRYGRKEIHVDHEFVEMVAVDDEGFTLDLSKLHKVEPIV